MIRETDYFNLLITQSLQKIYMKNKKGITMQMKKKDITKRTVKRHEL